MSVLVTGGAGFIGSTITSALLDEHEDVVVIDDLSTGIIQFTNGRRFYRGSIGDRTLLKTIFSNHGIETVIHCAAKIVVPESVRDPMGYYRNNISYGQILVEEALDAGCDRFIFSSSGSIYAPEAGPAFREDALVRAHSPYSQTKVDFETYLRFVANAERFNVISLRYFNPIGCDPLYRTGMQILHPSHVLGKIMQAIQEGIAFTITGTDWPTRDGSGIRDYIHVWDLAQAHLAALRRLRQDGGEGSFEVFNVGTGNGVTVRELVEQSQIALETDILVHEGPRRPGDVIGGFAVTTKAERLLGWNARRTLRDGIRDSAEWASRLRGILKDPSYAPD